MKRSYSTKNEYRADARKLALEGWKVEFADRSFEDNDPLTVSPWGGASKWLLAPGCLLALIQPLILIVIMIIQGNRWADRHGWDITYVRPVPSEKDP